MEIDTTSRSLLTTPDVDILSQTQYRVYDCLLAAGLCLCFLIGLPGNCISLTYFLRSKNRNLPTLLYITACCIDILTGVFHSPVAINLLNKRNPGLFGNKVFCGIWYFIFPNLQTMSMFVVMMLSVTRAIVIIFPFYKIRKRTVLITIVIACLYNFSWISLYIAYGKHYYSRGFTYCDFDKEPELIHNIFFVNYSLWLGIIPSIVFFTSIAVIFSLKTQNQMNASRVNFRQVSVTVICFSVVFLICNFFTFLNMVLLTYCRFSGKDYLHVFGNTFLFFYSWQLCYILICTVLNATLNPILYMFRFKGMRDWLINCAINQ